ncbi:MAG: Ig-like domain-containing protein, partial [Actinobacteria bacterium]|nr:Ig-like domain-containing protein [Actinomycetota bacterium]
MLAAGAVAGALAIAGSAATGPGAWEVRQSSGPNRQEVSYVESGGKLYLAGGGTAHEVYDPSTGAWSTIAPLPANLDHIQGVALGGRIYYIGGLAGWPSPHVSSVYVYDPTSNTFSTGQSMPRGRGAGGVAAYNGKIYYAGGLSNGAAVPWFDVYDPVANTWTQLPDMPRARDHFHATVVGGKFYAIGGRNTAIDATTAANDAYDLTAASWQTGLAPLPTPRGGFAAAAVGGEIFIIGGEGGGQAFNTVEAYDPVANTWRQGVSAMPTPRHGIQAAVCNGAIYIAGGGTTQGGATPTDVHEVFFPSGTTTCGSGAGATPGGLTGDYYDNQDFSNLKLTRVDPTVNFNWGSGSPDASIGGDSFSVRWTGQVKADFTQTYTFYTTSNDGVRLWVDNKLLIDNWSDHAATENSGTVALQAGQWYPLKLEYYEGNGQSVISLSYSSPSTPKAIIPSDHLASAGTPPPPPADTTKPTVTAKTPAAGATGIAAGANVTATFSEAMQAASISGSTFTLVKQGAPTTPVAAAVTYSASGNVATLNPDANLEAGAGYTATVKGGAGGAADLAGNTLAADETWSFTVAAATPPPSPGGTVLFRVNAGGPSVAGTPAWSEDSGAAPSPYVNTAAAGNSTAATGAAIDTSHPSVPAGTPAALFADERYDVDTAPEMEWNFPVTVGSHEVRLYFAETFGGTQAVGARKFDVTVEGQLVLNDYDVFAEVGANKGVVKTFTVSSDANLDIDFGHVVENPSIKAIEILSGSGGGGTDITKPTVTARTPAAGTTGVAAGANVTATFSEAMNAATINGTSFTLMQGTTSAPAAVTYSTSGNVATLNPNTDLTAGATYTATVKGGTGGVADSAGNTLAANDTWTFTVATAAPPPGGGSVVYRINAGGPAVTGTPAWSADTAAAPSVYVNTGAAGNTTSATGAAIDTSHASVPAGTPAALFADERYDVGTAPEMEWNFPVTAGSHEVRLYFAETYGATQALGARKFDVTVEGQLVLNDYDVFAEVGANKGVVKTFTVSSDANLDIDFGHVVENPAVKAIEILSGSGGGGGDTTKPTVTARTPAPGTTGVAAGANVTATFSEAMNAATINGTNFTLMQG